MNRILLDTSVVVGAAEALPISSDDTTAISVVTIGELHAGVRLAEDPSVRAARQGRLDAVRAAFEPIAVDELVAYAYGELLAFARSRRRTSKATDLLIIATASATGRKLLTLDGSQASLATAAGIPVAK